MSCLLKELSPTSGRTVLVSQEHNRDLSDVEIVECYSRISAQHWLKLVQSKKVGLVYNSNFALSLLLLSLDGIAAQITLLPHNLNPDDFVSMVKNADIEMILTDMDSLPVMDIPIMYEFTGFSNNHGTARNFIPRENYTDWILPTSGTTRTPKLVAHSLQTLSRSVKRDQAKGKSIRWGLLYDLNRFAGLQVFLQSILGGATLLIPTGDLSLDERLLWLADQGCNAISATPSLWRKILMTPASKVIPLKIITLGGEIADQSILNALSQAYPLAKITHIYASTEAGVGFSVNDCHEGFPISYLNQEQHAFRLRVSDKGILEIMPSLVDQRYVGEVADLLSGDGFISTGDLVEIKNDRVLFLGRDSGAINVGGNKVQPEKVEKVLLEHPSVVLASVSGKKSGITGALVEARVQCKSDMPSATVADLRAWCTSRLERYEVPAIIRIVDQIEINATGKLIRKS